MIVADALVLNRHQAISNYADDVCHINFITPQAKSHLINNARKRSGCRRAAWRWLCVIGRYIYRWYFLHWKSVYFYLNFTDIGPKGSISQQWVSIGRKTISVTDSLVVNVNTRCARFHHRWNSNQRSLSCFEHSPWSRHQGDAIVHKSTLLRTKSCSVKATTYHPNECCARFTILCIVTNPPIC